MSSPIGPDFADPIYTRKDPTQSSNDDDQYDYRKVFQSSNLLQGRYNPRTQLLTLEFGLKGAKYEFDNFPIDMWFKLTSAISPGEFYHQMIKPNYNARRMS